MKVRFIDISFEKLIIFLHPEKELNKKHKPA